MRVLVKLVCDRCFAMYRSELAADGWTVEREEGSPEGGICSVCGRVEGHRTVQLQAPRLPDEDPLDEAERDTETDPFDRQR